jgi:hypothetical protein
MCLRFKFCALQRVFVLNFKIRCTLMPSTRTCNSHEGLNFDLPFGTIFVKTLIQWT